jgi:hypothetical protein
MKKRSGIAILSVLLCATMPAKETGIDTGAEFGVEFDSGDTIPYIDPLITYTNSFGNIGVFFQIDYTIPFKDTYSQELYAEELLRYKIWLSPLSNLFLILNNSNTINTFNKNDAIDTVSGTVIPKVQYVRRSDSGTWYTATAFPIQYASFIKDAAAAYFTRISLGWNGSFGLGTELNGTFALYPNPAETSIGVSVDYEYNFFGVELEITAKKDFKVYIIDPAFELYFGRSTVWAGVYFENIGGDGNVHINPYFGAKYSF